MPRKHPFHSQSTDRDFPSDLRGKTKPEWPLILALVLKIQCPRNLSSLGQIVMVGHLRPRRLSLPSETPLPSSSFHRFLVPPHTHCPTPNSFFVCVFFWAGTSSPHIPQQNPSTCVIPSKRTQPNKITWFLTFHKPPPSLCVSVFIKLARATVVIHRKVHLNRDGL